MLRHKDPIKNLIDSDKPKWCVDCEAFHPLREFSTVSRNGKLYPRSVCRKAHSQRVITARREEREPWQQEKAKQPEVQQRANLPSDSSWSAEAPDYKVATDNWYGQAMRTLRELRTAWDQFEPGRFMREMHELNSQFPHQPDEGTHRAFQAYARAIVTRYGAAASVL